MAVLLVLTILFVGATGMFLSSRAELRIGIGHASSTRAFYLAEAGLATWLAGPVQPAAASYAIAGDSVSVEARRLLRVDSVTVLFEVSATARVGRTGNGPDVAARATRVLARRIGPGPAVAVRGSWREVVDP